MQTWLVWTFVAVSAQRANGLARISKATREGSDYLSMPMMYDPQMYYPMPLFQPDGIMRQQMAGEPVETAEEAMPSPDMQASPLSTEWDTDPGETQAQSAEFSDPQKPEGIAPPPNLWSDFKSPLPPPVSAQLPTMPGWVRSYSPPILFKNIFPGPEYMSFYVTHENMEKAACDQLIQKPSGNPVVCTGTTDPSAVASAMKDRPLQCLNDKLWGPGGIYAKICEMCAAKQLDGVVWTSTSRNNRPCHERYAALNRIVSYINKFDGEILLQINKAVAFVKKSIKRYKSMNTAIAAAGQELNDNGDSTAFFDTNDDGKASIAELKSFLQATFVIQEVIPQIGDVVDADMNKLSAKDKAAWLEFAPKFGATSL